MHRTLGRFIRLGATAALFAAGPLYAAGTAVQSERLTYKVMLGGLHIGDALVALDQTESGYTSEMKMTARGVASWVQNFRADIKGQGSFIRNAAANGGIELLPQPAAFNRQWSTGEIASEMTMTFDPLTRDISIDERLFNPLTGAVLAREDMPWNNRREKQKPVPMDLRKNALDPMAAFIAARTQILAQGVTGSTPKTFRVPIYDGTRRYDIVGRTAPARMITINNVERLLMPLTAKVEPVFGFNRQSMKRMEESEGKFLFTPDNRLIPVQLIVGSDMLTSVMNLTADCSEDAAPCDTFGQTAATD